MKTYSAKSSDVDKKWFVIDAEGVVLGRLASVVSMRLRGKHKPLYTPNVDCGDNIIIVNAEKVRLTGNKPEQKKYFRHTGYMGHERFTPVAKMLKQHPERVIQYAVWGMLPKGTLGRQVLRKKLKVYAGPDHPHHGQNPTPIDLK